MNTIKSIRTNNNEDSCSRARQFIGVPVIGKDGKLLNGEIKYRFENEEEDTICRFRDGLLDGNIYDESGNLLEKRPALEYGFGGTEYWRNGVPDGFPAIVQNFGYYEEDWQNGKIQEIRNEVEVEPVE
ncbi:hypothetical protein [Treponema sp. UBA753]|uniref:hypothetical protein n=1 Tax=Treponema sp. UBA753 TaxID=1947747 RepID=UPI0025DE1A02|nr:hypothetical protein [Treponema sp. UBA753]